MMEKEGALVCSFIAMLVIASSYFFRKKEFFLLMQGLGICGLMSAYLFNGQYFAMIGLGIGLARCVVFYLYEKQERVAPMAWAIGLCLASLAAYFIVNLWVLGTANPVDVIYLTALVMYVFIFRVRNIKFVRYACLLPTALSILYSVLAQSPVFAVISYSFELAAGLVSVLKYHAFGAEPQAENKE